jgi:hypothetical protein
MWDHPEKRVGRSQDILDMIQREMGGKMAQEEQETQNRVPLFPKT